MKIFDSILWFRRRNAKCSFPQSIMRYRLCLFAVFVELAAVPMSDLRAQSVPKLTARRGVRIDGTVNSFTAIGAILIASKGRVIVPQGFDNEVLFFSASGKLESRVGRRGNGPGEFINLGAGRSGLVGDTLWVYDPGTSRLTFLSAQGKVQRSQPLAAQLSSEQGASQVGQRALLSFQPLSIHGGGSVTGVGQYGIVSRTTPSKAESYLIRVASTGAVERMLLRIPDSHNLVTAQEGGTSTSVSVPAYARPLVAASSTGTFIAKLETEWTSGGNAFLDIVLLRAAGDTAYKKRLTVHAAAISSKAADSMLAVVSKQTSGAPPKVRAELARRLKEQMPKWYAPVRFVDVADDGSLWLTMRTDSTTASFLMLDPRGAPRASVTLPRNPRLVAVSRDTLWGVEYDRDDIPSIVSYILSSR